MASTGALSPRASQSAGSLATASAKMHGQPSLESAKISHQLEVPVDPASPAGIPKGFMANYSKMCLFFGLNHATMVVTLELSTVILGEQVGGAATGIFFGALALAVGCFASKWTANIGAKYTMCISMLLYTAYVACYLICVYHLCDDGSTPLDPDKHPMANATCTPQKTSEEYKAFFETWRKVSWETGLIGGFIGGFGAGWLWTGQGTYFTLCSHMFAGFTDTPLTNATAKFAATFGMFFLFGETMLKLGSFFILRYYEPQREAYQLLFIIMTAIAGGTSLAICIIENITPPVPEANAFEPPSPISTRIYTQLSAIVLLWEEPKALLLVGYNTFYSFSLTFVLLYVSRMLLAANLGPNAVMMISLVNSLVGGLTMDVCISGGDAAPQPIVSLIWSSLSNKIKKINVVQTGSCIILAYLCIYLAFYYTTNYSQPCYALPREPSYCPEHQLQSDRINWGSAVALYFMSGLSRGIYEGVFKGVWADYFATSGKVEAAFSCVNFQQGIASLVAFYIFPYLGPNQPESPSEPAMIIICMCLMPIALVMSAGAQYVHENFEMVGRSLVRIPSVMERHHSQRLQDNSSGDMNPTHPTNNGL